MSTPSDFSRITILGTGLLGGSIARAIHERMPHCDLRIWARREEPLAYARAQGITPSCSTDLASMLEDTELIILATPIGVFKQLAERMLPFITPDTLITDVGSVKAYVHRHTGSFLHEHGHFFIGSHPMAGGEKQGIEYSNASLLQDARVVLTNEQSCPEELLCKLERFWHKLGAIPYRMGATEHDKTVSRISHIPHVLAALCARGADSGDVPLKNLQQLAATGFRDTSRVSLGAPSMWADIIWENDVAIRETLHHCVQDLQSLIGMLESQDKAAVEEWLKQAKTSRERIYRESESK